jgi:hypothetical protein
MARLSHIPELSLTKQQVSSSISLKWSTKHQPLAEEVAAAATTVSQNLIFATRFQHLAPTSPRCVGIGVVWINERLETVDAVLLHVHVQEKPRVFTYNCDRRRLVSPRRRVPHQGNPHLLQLRREGPREPRVPEPSGREDMLPLRWYRPHQP